MFCKSLFHSWSYCLREILRGVSFSTCAKCRVLNRAHGFVLLWIEWIGIDSLDWIGTRDQHMNGYVPVTSICTGTSPWPAYARVLPRDRHLHGYVPVIGIFTDMWDTCLARGTHAECLVTLSYSYLLFESNQYLYLYYYEGTPIRMCHNSILYYPLTILLIFDLDKTL